MTLRARLDRLEKRLEPERGVLVVALWPHETHDQALARHCGDDRPHPNTLIVFIRRVAADGSV